MAERLPPELELNPDTTLKITEINEGSEPKEFFKGRVHNFLLTERIVLRIYIVDFDKSILLEMLNNYNYVMHFL